MSMTPYDPRGFKAACMECGKAFFIPWETMCDAGMCDPCMANKQVTDLAREFIAYYQRGGGCSNCGGLPHSNTCFVGRFIAALESATPQNAGATKPEGSPSVGAHTSSSLVLSSSSLRTLVEQLHRQIMNLPSKPKGYGERPEEWRRGYGFGHKDARHAAAELVAALLSPVAVDEKEKA